MTISTLRSHMARREADLAESTITIRAAPTRSLNGAKTAYTETPGATIWTGPAQIREQSEGRDADVADIEDRQSRWTCKIPATVTTVEVGHHVTVDESPDSDLADRVLRVAHTGVSDWHPVRRLVLVDDQPGA